MGNKSSTKTKKETDILICQSLAAEIEQTNTVGETEYPFCSLRPDYFEFALSRLARGVSQSTFSVQRLDQQTILEVLRKQ